MFCFVSFRFFLLEGFFSYCKIPMAEISPKPPRQRERDSLSSHVSRSYIACDVTCWNRSVEQLDCYLQTWWWWSTRPIPCWQTFNISNQSEGEWEESSTRADWSRLWRRPGLKYSPSTWISTIEIFWICLFFCCSIPFQLNQLVTHFWSKIAIKEINAFKSRYPNPESPSLITHTF